MKKLFLILIGIVYVLSSANIHAQNLIPLGKYNFALKLGYNAFTDDYFTNIDDDGFYGGLEGYGKIASKFYIGGEIGQGGNWMSFGEDLYFIPIEVNVKYASEFAQNLVVDFGAGISYSYATIKRFSFFEQTEERDDWLFGGQIFADLSYRIIWLSIGINSKYQITQSFKDEDFDLSNYKLGVQIGIIL
jgi:hypothetical protein